MAASISVLGVGLLDDAAFWRAVVVADGAQHLPLATRVMCDGDRCTWGEWLSANADGLTSSELAEIGASLSTIGTYLGGGGAAGSWTLALVAHAEAA